MEELKTKLRQYQENSYYDDSDIAEKLIELSNLELTNDIKVELENAINYLNMVARNEYNDDQFRVLYNGMALEEAVDYAKDHLDEIPCGELEYISDSDELDEENCDFEE